MEHPPIIDYEGSDYQASFWEQGGRAYEDRVEAVALRRLLPEGGELLLELGAGAVRNTARYRGFRRIVLLDYSLTQLQQAQERLGRGDNYIYVAGDVYRLPFVNGLFDAATMVRVLHHIAEVPRVLGQIRRVLQTGAPFILEYANKQNLKAILRYTLRRQDWNPFTPEPVEFVPLNYDFHPRTVRKWLEEQDFTIERQLTVSHFRVGWLKRVVPVSVLVFLDSLAQLTGDRWQLTPSVFSLNRAVGSLPSAPVSGFFLCPACGGARLEERTDALSCLGCGQEWPVVDGIYDFRGK
jgi:ubiquinone/menaquinone biosynthesis C-methylase UbiE